jgi:hypothetical protein
MLAGLLGWSIDGRRLYRHPKTDDMCQLVTIGIPRALGSTLTAFGGPREGLAVTPARNPHVALIFPKSDLLFDVTVGGCSCDLVGRFHGDRADVRLDRRRRYEKLGWSPAKIDRALRASSTAHERDRSGVHARTFRDGVLLLLERAPTIRLFVHMYKGDFDTEPVASKGTARSSRSEYESSHGAFPEDTLVEVSG